MNIALIIAGGSGNRMGQDIPKQFIHVDDCPIIIHTMKAFERHPDVHVIAVVCLEGWETVLRSYANQFSIKKLKWIFPGGNTGMESIHNGIYGLKHEGCTDVYLTMAGHPGEELQAGPSCFVSYSLNLLSELRDMSIVEKVWV